MIHGTFILGLPGETKETIEETIRFANEINPHTIQVSLAAPYPGTFLHRQAMENQWLVEENTGLVTEPARKSRHELPASEPHRDFPTPWTRSIGGSISGTSKIAAIAGEMLRSPEMMKRRLREGMEFFQFLRERREPAL